MRGEAQIYPRLQGTSVAAVWSKLASPDSQAKNNSQHKHEAEDTAEIRLYESRAFWAAAMLFSAAPSLKVSHDH